MSCKSIWDMTLKDEDSEEQRKNRVLEKPSTPLSIKLHSNVVKGCQTCGLSKPNKLQLQVLSHFAKLSFQNLLISAPPRAGKTSSAVIGILDNFSRATSKYSLAIIVCPTYEIAENAYSCCQILGSHCDVFFSFTAKDKRINKDDVHSKELVIGTPDKILDFSRKSLLELKKASFLVIDEADCLGNPKKFFSDISQLFQRLSPKCRSILCTVSRSNAVNDFIEKHMDSPIVISLTDTTYRRFPIKRLYLVCPEELEKVDSLIFLINMQNFQGKVVVFTETKETAKELSLHLNKNSLTSLLLTGDISILQRRKVLEDFKTSAAQILITTRSFVSIIPAGCATKLIHYDQILDEKDKLDTNVYNRRDYLLSTKDRSLMVYVIEKRWEEYLFKDKDVINEKSFFSRIEIINHLKLKDYFNSVPK